MPYKRILTIQDISCVGQCSMTVALPILSACGHETCILPAALLSTHTGGFGKPAVNTLGEFMEQAVQRWKDNEIYFDLIYVGYLGSVEAVLVAERVLETMLTPDGIIVVDPAMADHGKRYSGLDDAYADAMMRLCRKADIIVPNMTEASMMAGISYRDDFNEDDIRDLIKRLPGKNVVLTGVGFTEDQTGFALRGGEMIRFYSHRKLGKAYSGTGDIFAATFCGAIASGKEMMEAAQIAAQFVVKCIEATMKSPAHWYGVKFEVALPELIELLHQK